uniref:Uncharacterized protein n=1 Tax=Rhizophora mucronata TaxID=61149 RepID=A0A2P2J0Y4_RHIMU
MLQIDFCLSTCPTLLKFGITI